MMPSEFLSKGWTRSRLVKAGVLLKHIYMKGELSVSTPPVSITSQRPSLSSEMAIFIAARELPHAASTTQLVPPRLSRLATLPAITFPRSPGNEFSSHLT